MEQTNSGETPLNYELLDSTLPELYSFSEFEEQFGEGYVSLNESDDRYMFWGISKSKISDLRYLDKNDAMKTSVSILRSLDIQRPFLEADRKIHDLINFLGNLTGEDSLVNLQDSQTVLNQTLDKSIVRKVSNTNDAIFDLQPTLFIVISGVEVSRIDRANVERLKNQPDKSQELRESVRNNGRRIAKLLACTGYDPKSGLFVFLIEGKNGERKILQRTDANGMLGAGLHSNSLILNRSYLESQTVPDLP